jgi:hypothetical protein
MDADDLAHPSRLQKQVDFLDQHPDVGVCGTWVEPVSSGRKTQWRYAQDHEEIRCRQLFQSSVAQGSVMMRTTLVAAAGGYDLGYQAAEDYDLWVRLAEHTRLANLPEVLYQYRQHAAQKTRVDRASGRQSIETMQIQARLLRQLGLNPNEADLRLHDALSYRRFEQTPHFVERAASWLERLVDANVETRRYQPQLLESVLAELWYLVCRAAARQGWWAVRRYGRSPLGKVRPLSPAQWLWFAQRVTLHTLRIPPRGARPAMTNRTPQP